MSNIKVKGGQSGSSPLSFKAGGKSPSSPTMGALSNGSRPNRSPSHPAGAAAVRSSDDMNIKMHHKPSHLSILQTGISNKKSPVQIKNWITCVLTLDGRDKFTKILQYSSRLLCWYFAGLAKQCNATTNTTSSGIATIAGTYSLLSMLFTNIHVREQYYSALSKRFDELYKSLVTSRKAFRLGRSIIELDKLSSMGWGQYLTYMLLHPLAGGVADGDGAASKLDAMDSKGGTMNATTKSHSIRYDTHPIPEEEGDHDGEDESENSWNEDEEKKLDTPSPTQRKVVARPGRPKLVSKISSNIGWGPSSAASTEVMTQTSLDKTSIPPPISTPLWKLMGGTAKLLGLCGFWFFDNISFLTGSGFLDPICGVEKAVVVVDPKASDRTKRKALATEWAARCYFLGSIGGFYYNLRALIEHRKTKFKEACDRLREATLSGCEIDEATSHMEQIKQQQFEIWVALLKSCADVMVFSNNPGVDLHLKYRGKKNHEGLHCLGGLISASTVLYANFPNAK
ncbi:hypothetical protein ACHAXH_005854 [Discostella pseudostelligera]